jgi:hypothetical protein
MGRTCMVTMVNLFLLGINQITDDIVFVYVSRLLLTITSWKAVMLVISSKKQLDHTPAFATR